jgi:Acyl-CoA synthetases (AMP-forming)/AMP-acid ligases II
MAGLNTGDLGYLEDGQIVVTGRAKDLIILNGRNIWPQDLEWTAEHEVAALRNGGVVAFSIDDVENEQVVVLVECRLGDPEQRDQIVSQVNGVLRSHHGVEARVVPVAPRALPRTSSGKLSRSKAKQLYLRGSLDPIDAEAS